MDNNFPGYTIHMSLEGDMKTAEIISDSIVIGNLDDAIDLLGNCSYQGAFKIILHENQLASDFFDLKTKLAGDILQKFSNYRMKLAIIGDFSKYGSQSLRDFIYESNKGKLIRFALNIEEVHDF